MRSLLFWCESSGNALLFLVLLGLSIGGQFPEVHAGPGGDCVTCHADVWRDIQSKRYIHRPVAKGDCKYCHVAVETERNQGATYKDRIKWVARGYNPGKEHWLEFDDARRGATLLVEARYGKSEVLKEFSLPAFDELEEFPGNDTLPPKIGDVRLVDVEKGIFVSATIAWETDKPADSQVYYGLDRPEQASLKDQLLVTNHVVALMGVKPGKTYKYKVVSVDEAGNRSESPVKTLLVEVSAPGRLEKPKFLDETEPEIKVRNYRRGKKCLVIVNAGQAVTVRLGVLPKKYAEEGREDDGPKVVRHAVMNSPMVTNIGVCYTCHVEYQKILSHPINVYPKPGMIIPPEYATLPDGRISCMSCHATHASNIEFRVIKASKKELCRGCHQDMQ